jgi:hypothetical protein
MIENSLRNMKLALDKYTALLVYYYVMRIDNLTNENNKESCLCQV